MNAEGNAGVSHNTDSYEFNTPTAVNKEIDSITAHSPPSLYANAYHLQGKNSTKGKFSLWLQRN